MSGEEENATDADYEDIIVDMLWPNELEFATLPVFLLLLSVGLVSFPFLLPSLLSSFGDWKGGLQTGDFLVVFVVLRNEGMRTMTNLFLVNLALADFLVLLFCLPPSVLWDVTKTWWFGTPICKIVLYLQAFSSSPLLPSCPLRFGSSRMCPCPSPSSPWSPSAWSAGTPSVTRSGSRSH